MRRKGRRKGILRFRRSLESWIRRTLTHGVVRLLRKLALALVRTGATEESLREIIDGGGGKTRIHLSIIVRITVTSHLILFGTVHNPTNSKGLVLFIDSFYHLIYPSN